MRLAAIVTTLALIVGVGGITPALGATESGANNTQLTVEPSTIDNLTGQVMVTVSGINYSTTANQGFGVYVSFGPQPTPGDTTAFSDASRYYNAGPGLGTIWVRPGASTGADNAQLNTNGSFSIQLAVKATYTGANLVSYDGTTQQLGVLTYAAHGTENGGFSQLAFVPITFEEPGGPATAPGAPGLPTLTALSDTALSASWTAPTDTGGSPITGYEVTLRTGTATTGGVTTTLNGSATSTVLSGLDPDTSYNVVVAAVNAAGTGPVSPAAGPPAAPRVVARTQAAAVAADFGGLRWKISHQAWSSTSLAGITDAGNDNGHLVTGPATRTTNGFLFPASGEGSYDPSTGEAQAAFSGTVEVGNNAQGGYRIRFTDPSISVDASGIGTITAGISYRTSTAGAFVDRGRIAVTTFAVAPSEVTSSPGHLVIQTPLDATFTSVFLSPDTGLAPSLAGHFQASGAAADPLKPPSPIAAGFDVPVVDDPLSDYQVISTTVVETGSLVISVEDHDVTLTSPELQQNGSLLATGNLNPVTVIDLRSANPGWTASGQVTDFTGDGGSFAGAGLSWTPSVLSSSDGQVVTTPAGPIGGLDAGQTLASAQAGQGRGTAVMGAGLFLAVPTSTGPGTYSATLTLTVI